MVSPPATPSHPWHVHKFGGTSLGGPSGYRNAARLVTAPEAGRAAVVVSAPAGVTDALLDAVELAARDDAWGAALGAVRERVCGIASELLDGGAEAATESIAAGVREVEDVLRGVVVARTGSEAVRELVSGYGELWSALLLASLLGREGRAAERLDAREVLVVEHGRSGALVHWEESGIRLERWLAEHPDALPVVTGYVARDPDGVPTTLKRNGSDFSASIFGKLLAARSITIWTDVDGVMSADPRAVPEAVRLERLSYDEAIELAYFGAQVLHPRTMGPAAEAGIPVRIRCAARPDLPGTVLAAGVPKPEVVSPREVVKGFSCIDDVDLLEVEGDGMIGVPGIAGRLFEALRAVEVSVVMISQASSEHSICVAVRSADAERARAGVERAFAAELQHRQVRTVQTSGPYSILAAVGDNMVDTRGVAARFFAALGNAGISVRAIAQGSSQRNISAVVARGERTRALRAAHAGFYLSDQTLALGIVGAGRVGAELLRQIAAQAPLLHERHHIDLRVCAVATSRRMVLDADGLDPARQEELLAERGEALDLDRLARVLRSGPCAHAAVVDCTASDDVAARYAEWLGAGLHVVTPNKKAGSGPAPAWRALQERTRAGHVHYLYEATVGAGLPVVQTLRDLLRSGDRVHTIEGVLSGTLSFLFNGLSADRPFSELVREARERGFTEPDPREDLAGTDVARKAVILAREVGLELELADVEVESLVPAALRESADFLTELPVHDAAVEERRARAERAGEVLRYVARVETGLGPQGGAPGAFVGVRAYPRSHLFAHMTGTDNVLAFTTDRYREQPLIVQGPGAGPAVTAGGVFADLLRITASLGALP